MSNLLPDPKTPHDRYLHDIATTNRAILDHLTGATPNVSAGEVEIREPATVDLDSMKRADLNAYATKVGVEDPDKLPNIAAVKQAITEAAG